MVESYYNEPSRPEKKPGSPLFDWQDHAGEGKAPGAESDLESGQTRKRLALEASSPGSLARTSNHNSVGDVVLSMAAALDQPHPANAAAQNHFADKNAALKDSNPTKPQAPTGKADGWSTDSKATGQPAWLVKGQENKDLFADKPSVAVKDANANKPQEPTRKTDDSPPGAKATGQPAWLVKGQERNDLFADKPAVIPVRPSKADDSQKGETGRENSAPRVSGLARNGFDDRKATAGNRAQGFPRETESVTHVPQPRPFERRQSEQSEDRKTPEKSPPGQAVEIKAQHDRLPSHRLQEAQALDVRPPVQKAVSSLATTDGKLVPGRMQEFEAAEIRRVEATTSGHKGGPQYSEERKDHGPALLDEGLRSSRPATQIAREPELSGGVNTTSETRDRRNACFVEHQGKQADRLVVPETSTPARGREESPPPQKEASRNKTDAVTHSESKSAPRFDNVAPTVSLEKTGQRSDKLSGEASIGGQRKSEEQKLHTSLVAESARLGEVSIKSTAPFRIVDTEAQALEGSKPTRKESASEAAAPTRVVPGQNLFQARVAIVEVQSRGIERTDQLPGTKTRETRAADAGRGTRSDTTPAPTAVPANDAGHGKTKTLPAADVVGTIATGAPTRIDVPVRISFVPAIVIDGQKSLTVKDIRGPQPKSNVITDKRYITGTEIALAAVIAAAGASRIRAESQTGKTGLAAGSDQSLSAQVKPTQDTRLPGKDKVPQSGVAASADQNITPQVKPLVDFRVPVKGQSGSPTSGEQTVASQVKPAVDSQTPPKDPVSQAGKLNAGLIAPTDRNGAVDRPIGADRRTVSGAEMVLTAENPCPSGETFENGQLQELLPPLEIVDQTFQQFGDTVGESERAQRESCAATTSETETDFSAAAPPPVIRRPSVLMSAGDTLVSVAEAFFHDPNLAWLIADINQSRIKETRLDGKRVVEIRSRQQIDLPVWEDIVDFYRTHGSNARPDNIVTIVEETRLDVDVLQSTLGWVIGAAPTTSSPLAQSCLLRRGAQDYMHSTFKHWRS